MDKKLQNDLALPFKKEYRKVLAAIKRYDKIAIFRHIKPDYDALGTQYGLATWIKDNFPNKDVITLGDNHVTFTPRGLYPESSNPSNDWFNDKFLAIIVDVGDYKRIADPRFSKAKYKIKVDHHPVTDTGYNVSITNTSMIAASELVCNMLISFGNKYVFSKEAASYFYTGIVGDSGRFQYGDTSPYTFELAAFLVSKGFNIVKIYAKMYERSLDDLEMMKFVLNNYKVTSKGVAYYILTEKDLENLHIESQQGKDQVNMFANIEGIKIWCSITEDTSEPCYRISIRSRDYTINGVATQFAGGGHNQAAGCQIKNLDELPLFLKALDDLIK